MFGARRVLEVTAALGLLAVCASTGSPTHRAAAAEQDIQAPPNEYFEPTDQARMLPPASASLHRRAPALGTAAHGTASTYELADCSGMQPTSINVGASFQAGVTPTVDQRGVNCVITTRFFYLPSPNRESTLGCTVTLTPNVTQQATTIEVTSPDTAACSGVAAKTSISGGQDGAASGVSGGSARSLTLYHRDLDARIIGNDPFHYPMFIVSAQLGYDYDYVDVYDPLYGQFNNNDYWWYTVFQTLGGGYGSDGMDISWYSRYNYTHNYSDGFPSASLPDTEAWVQPTANGYSNGAYDCGFYCVWGSPYPGFSWTLSCGHNP